MDSTILWPRRLMVWARHLPWRRAALVLLIAFALLNLLAYLHARSMLTYSAEAARTPPPQSLSVCQKLKVLVCGVTIPRPENTRTPHELGLASETLHVAADGDAKLECWLLAPPNPRGTVLLFHGYAACRSSLLDEARAFYEMGFRAILVDFRGGGGSDGCGTTLGYHEAEDVAAMVRHVRATGRPGPLILYGQSMGGAAVLRSIAALDVRPDAVIVESVFGRMLGAVRNRFALMGLPAFPAAELIVFWGGMQVGFSGFEHNPAEYARACTCPALVLHGLEDRHATPEESAAIHEHLAGHKTLVSFPGVGHTSLHRAAPETWRAAVESFLATQVVR
jgi:alpha-beta hydrolase superfamily lysophospholipase